MRYLRRLMASALLATTSMAHADSRSADIESLEACVLETAVANHEESCIGLLSAHCVDDGGTPLACMEGEVQLWFMIWSGTFATAPTPGARGMQTLTERLNGCTSDGVAKAQCALAATAGLAIPAFLAIEGQ